MNSTNDKTYFKPKCRGFKYSGSSEEYYKKGLEILDPSMQKFFNSLKVSPKVLFVKLHKLDKHPSNGCLYKLRNKSTIQFLTPSEVKNLAKKDVELMYKIVKRKILSLGKVNTLNVDSTVSSINKTVFCNDSETSSQTFSKKKNFIRHSEDKCSTLPLLTCTFCKKRFTRKKCLKNHMKTRHSTFENRNDSHEFDESCEIEKKRVSNDFSCEVLCCACLKLIVEVRPLLDSLLNNVCLQCIYCELRLSVGYFLHHIATVHLLCKQDECHSKYIDTGYRLRQVLTMEDEFECIHVDCDHYFFIDLNEPNVTITVDDVDLNHIIKYEENCQDNNESETNFEMKKEEKEDVRNREEESCLLENNCNDLEELTIFDTDVKNMNHHFIENQDTPNSISIDSFAKSEDSLQIPSEKITLQCSICKRNFQHEQKLLRHLFIKHRFTHPFTCDVCFLCFEDVKELEIHAQVHRANFVPADTNLQSFHAEKESTTENMGLTVTDSELTISEDSVKKTVHQDVECPSENFELETPCVVKNVEIMEVSDIESTITSNSIEETIHQDVEYPSEDCELGIPCVVKNTENMEVNDIESTITSNSIKETIHQDVECPTENCELEILCVVKNTENMEVNDTETIHRDENCKIEIPCILENVENMEIIDSESTITSNFVKEETHQKRKNPPENCKMESSCNKVEKISSNSTKEPIYKEDKYSSKHGKAKIPCIVEKVEYPLDIHNLYAHIRKANDLTGINSSELRLETSFNDSNDIDMFPVEKSPKKHTFFDSHEIQINKLTNDMGSCVNFECKTCGKTFNSQKSYSEHLFFMHDAEFHDSVVLDLQKSSAYQEITSLPNTTDYSKILKSQNSLIPASAENNQSGKVMPNAKKPKQERTPMFTNTSDNLKVLKSPQLSVPINNVKSTKMMSNSGGKAKKRITSSPANKFNNLRVLKSPPVSGSAENQVMSNSNTKLESSNLYPCCDCKKRFLTNTMLAKHRRLIHLNPSKDVIKKESKIKRVTGKVSTKSRGTISKVQPVAKNEVIDSAHLTCSICNVILETSRGLQAHLTANHNCITDICLLCNKLFGFGRGLRHILDFHIVPSCEEEKEYKCFGLGNTKEDVNEAIQVLGKKRLMALCGYNNYTNSYNSTLFKCQSCSQSFSAIRCYRNHYLRIHDKFCTLCNLSFINNDDFLNHLNRIHHSENHYLWFVDTFISTILLTERTEGNLSETFQDIIRRKLRQVEPGVTFESTLGRDCSERISSSESIQMEENEVSKNSLHCYVNQINVITHNLSQTTYQPPGAILTTRLPGSQLPVESYEEEHGSPTKATKLDEAYNSNVFEFPDFCMECEVSENGTLVMPCDNGLLNPVIIENLNDINNAHDISESVNDSTVFGNNVPNIIFDYPIIISDNFINNLQDVKIFTDAEANDTDNHIFADIQLNGEK